MATDELILLERVFLRLGNAETDEQLQNVLWKFLPPVLLKLASPHEDVRKKVMELLIHVNKRLKSRSQVQLPMDALLTQYQDPNATSFVINFTIIYIKTGFPRLESEKQVELVPVVLNALDNKPQTHLDSLLLMIIPLLGKVEMPNDPSKRSFLFGLNEKPQLSKHLLGLMLDVLLLPYGSIIATSPESDQSGSNLSVPPGMSEHSYKRIISNNTIKSDELEETKLGIVKFLSLGVFSDEDVLIHFIVAAADTHFNVANFADNELKKVVGTVNWSSTTVSAPLFALYLGSQKNTKPEQKKVPASTRIRLKLLNYLCRVQGNGLTFPASIQIVFDSLYGTNTNSKLKSLALNFTSTIVRSANQELLSKVAPVLLSGMQKLINEGEETHKGQAYIIIGMIGQKFPKIVYHDVPLLESFFEGLDEASPDLKVQIREGLLNLILAYKWDNFPDECDKDGRVNILFALIKQRMKSEEGIVRFTCVKTLATIFPPNHVPSKYLLMVAIGDPKEEVSSEAFKSLYGMTKKTDSELTQAKKVELPPFDQITKYIFTQAESLSKDKSKGFKVGSQVLPFDSKTYTEILIFIRLCLIKNVKIPSSREILQHPCEYSPILREFLKDIYDEDNKNENSLVFYLKLIKSFMLAQPTAISLNCMIELVGCLPPLVVHIEDKTDWLKEQLSATKEEIRELSALLYSLIVCSNKNNYEPAINELLSLTSNKKTLETQHGAILALGYSLSNLLMNKENLGELHKNCVEIIYEFLKNQNALLVGAACSSIGIIGRCSALPLDDGNDKTGSPEAKRSNKITKMDVVNQLLDTMKNSKYSVKIREKAVKALGLISVGENFIHTKEILNGFLSTAKDTKDVEIHFTIGESIVMCCNSVWSVEARNFWTTLPNDYVPKNEGSLPNSNLEWFLDELLKLVNSTHPNAKQASSIWLLAVLKGCGQREPITKSLPILQNTFMDLLCENNDIIQDVASKGLCLVYDTYKSEELLTALVKQLTSGTTRAPQVTENTKLFDEGQLGKTPSGDKLTTYKELCSLASDLNKPDLIYQFLHLANHNAIWNSKKGAAFGFSSIAEKCGEDLKPHMALIVPKLYRYQFDPNHNIQVSMHNIWKVLVPEAQKTLDEFYDQILADLLENLNAPQYRVRQSCCLALQEFLKGPGNRSIHDCLNHMEELWNKIFRVMDDHHEATRLVANRTAKILSKLCVRACDLSQGQDGVKMVEAVLPPLLKGITSSVSEIRMVCLQTISELVGSAGKQLKPFLPQLIPALLQATGELESKKLAYLSTMFGAQSETQETIDNVRASVAKSHFTTETVAKTLQYADASILDDLVPKTIELLKGSMGLGTKIACAHFVTLLTVQMRQEIPPYTGKFLAALVSGMTDRNAAVRKHYATAIGHLVGTAKDSSIEKLLSKLQVWYFEREDDSIRSACAHTIHSIGIHNQDVFKNFSSTILPLVFFAMHAEKTPETENSLQIWNDIWSEHSPGTETGIRQNIDNIIEILKNALESPSWTMKAQAANGVATVASKLGSSMDAKHRNAMIKILLDGLSGRTWNGKDKLLNALASICKNCKDAIKADPDVDTTTLLDGILKECRKDEISYKISALKCLAETLSALDIDKFDEVYKIIQKILTDTKNKDDDDDLDNEEVAKHRENLIKLKQTAYETLGKTWPNNESTQKKYREMFVEHCVSCLPLITRSIQVSVVAALYSYVDKLIILDGDDENEALEKIVNNILIAIKYALGISKHTRLRKESLNVVLCLANKLKEHHENDFNKMKEMFNEILPDISKDNEPEIKSRVTDIKKILY